MSSRKMTDCRIGLNWWAVALVLLLLPWSIQIAAAERAVIYVAEPANRMQLDAPTLLQRELNRQAIILTAWQRFGVATRDEILREKKPSGEQITQLRIDVKYAEGENKLGTSVSNPANQKSVELDAIEVPMFAVADPFCDLAKLAAIVVAQSNAKHFELLTELGVTGQSLPPDADAPMPEVVESLLVEPTTAMQFRALRQLTAAAEKHGLSPKIRGGLIRAYTNLGLLSNAHWSPSSAVFQARALVLSEQWVAAAPTSVEALRHRAYAQMLIGLHTAAMESLKASGELEAGAPNWQRWIELMYRWDTDGFGKYLDGQNPGWPALLQAITIENSGVQADILNCVIENKKIAPMCLRLCSTARGAAGVSTWHEVYGSWFNVHTAQIQQLLAEEKLEFPELRIRALDGRAIENSDAKDTADATTALCDDDRRVEPSWSMLGRLLEEESFLGVRDRVYQQRAMIGVSADLTISQLWPLVTAHPYAKAIEFYRAQYYGKPDAFNELMRDLRITDPNFAMFPLEDLTWNSTSKQLLHGKDMTERYWRRFDPTAVLIERRVNLWRLFSNPTVVESDLVWVRRLPVISPESPGAVAAQIHIDFEQTAPRLAGDLARFKTRPIVLRALILKYSEKKDWNRALEYARTYNGVLMDPWGWNVVADLYVKERLNDQTAMINALEQVLKLPDNGLDHANANTRIAYAYCDTEEYARALPYARAAGSAGSMRGMDTLSHVLARLGQWDEASDVARVNAERYDVPFRWYFFLRSEGRTPPPAAEEIGRKFFEARAIESNTMLERAALFYTLLGEQDSADKYLKMLWAKAKFPFVGAQLAVSAHHRRKFAERDEILKELVDSIPTLNKQYRPIADVFIEYLRTLVENGKVNPGAEPWSGMLNRLEGDGRAQLHYLMATEMRQRGEFAAASKEFERGADYSTWKGTVFYLLWTAHEDCKAEAARLAPATLPGG